MWLYSHRTIQPLSSLEDRIKRHLASGPNDPEYAASDWIEARILLRQALVEMAKLRELASLASPVWPEEEP